MKKKIYMAAIWGVMAVFLTACGREQKELKLNWVSYADKEHGFESEEDALNKLMSSYQGDI